MGFADLWNRTLVYFGIAEEDEWDDEYAAEELERSYQERPNVRRLAPRRREREFDDWTDPGADRTEALRPTRLRRVPPPPAGAPPGAAAAAPPPPAAPKLPHPPPAARAVNENTP